MNKTVKKLSLLILAISFMVSTLTAQSHQISNAYFEVEGTSSLHDWTMESDHANATVNMKLVENRITSIEGFYIKVNAESLKSGKSTMDKIAYEALKSEDHPIINFNLTKINNINHSSSTANILATGILTIAGKSNTVKIEGVAVNKNGEIKLEGSKKIKMTDYEMEPPTAMFGTIKTGDDLTINYSITLKTK